jgi:hypothetical protein
MGSGAFSAAPSIRRSKNPTQPKTADFWFKKLNFIILAVSSHIHYKM